MDTSDYSYRPDGGATLATSAGIGNADLEELRDRIIAERLRAARRSSRPGPMMAPPSPPRTVKHMAPRPPERRAYVPPVLHQSGPPITYVDSRPGIMGGPVLDTLHMTPEERRAYLPDSAGNAPGADAEAEARRRALEALDFNNFRASSVQSLGIKPNGDYF